MAKLVKSNVKGALLALLAFGIFATHDVIVKYLGTSYSPFQIVFFSVTFGFPIVTFMLMNDRSEGTLLPRHPWWTALRTGAAVITGVTAFYAFTVLPLTQTYAILFATPLLITLLAIPILGERVRLRRGAAVVVGLIGVMVVLRPGSEPLSLGHLAALTAAVGGSFVSIIVRKIGQDERAVVLLLYPMVANFVVMGAALPFVYQPMPVAHLGGLALMALFGFMASLLVIASYRAAEAVIVAPMQYSQILWATAYGYLLFDEKPDLATAIGTAIIVASGIYIVLREDRPDVSDNQPVLRGHSGGEVGTAPRSQVLERLRAARDRRAQS